MDIYYTIEEKYLQAIDELKFGETPKGLQLLNDIIANDPLHARAHYQLGLIHYYELNDYQAAGYHFKTCAGLQPSFPDVYYHYMHLLVFLNMEKQVTTITATALQTPGVNHSAIYNLLGLLAEKQQKWTAAMDAYRKGFMAAIPREQRDEAEESIERITAKIHFGSNYSYTLTD